MQFASVVSCKEIPYRGTTQLIFLGEVVERFEALLKLALAISRREDVQIANYYSFRHHSEDWFAAAVYSALSTFLSIFTYVVQQRAVRAMKSVSGNAGLFEEVALGTGFSESFGFTLSVFYRCFVFTYIVLEMDNGAVSGSSFTET
jgi:hypothetical protein